MTGAQHERKGVVMEVEGFDDGTLDTHALQGQMSRALGSAHAVVSYITPAGIPYAADVDFSFDVPIDLR